MKYATLQPKVQPILTLSSKKLIQYLSKLLWNLAKNIFFDRLIVLPPMLQFELLPDKHT
jgi:hypothetical protein